MSVAREALGGQHRRGRSLSSTNMVKSEKDDDLALFHDMRRKERVNYLHPSADSDEALDSSLCGYSQSKQSPCATCPALPCSGYGGAE